MLKGEAKQFKELYSNDGILFCQYCKHSDDFGLCSGGHFIETVTKKTYDFTISFSYQFPPLKKIMKQKIAKMMDTKWNYGKTEPEKGKC